MAGKTHGRATPAEVQEAVFSIAEAAATAGDLDALYRSIHRVVAGLMPARNLYIALLDESGENLAMPYFVDEQEAVPDVGYRPLGNGLTEHVLRNRKPLLLGRAEMHARATRGDFAFLGRDCAAWMGVPLLVGHNLIGMLAVQSYSEEDRYTDADLDVLSFVSRQVAMAVYHRRLEEDLAETNRRLATLVDNLPGVVYRCRNDANWTMEFLSEGSRELTGYSSIDLVQNRVRSYASIIHPDDAGPVWTKIQEALKAGRPYTIEYRIITAYGVEKWVWEKGSGVCANGTLVALEGFITDITEAKKAEKERASLSEQLRQAQKMESVGLLAGGVAHDLNNLLMPILGYTDMLLDAVPEASPSYDMLNHVQQAAERARNLVRQLLAFSRRQVLSLSTVNLVTVVMGFQKILRSTIREEIAIEITVNDDEALVRADPVQMEQVILNLAVNAQDAMTTESGSRGKLFIEIDGTASHVVMIVRDTGVGMSTEVLSHAFEPFFTTKGAGRGTGLGLSTVYGIITQHGGEVTVHSEPGRGTEFRITLPRIAVPDPAPAGAAPENAPPKAGTETVLLVEDEKAVRDLSRTMLTRAGYNVIASSGGEEALAAARAYAGKIHIVITDVIMAGMNGRELASAIAPERPGIPILFTSGYTDEVIARHGVLESGMHFMAKPFTPRELTAKVRAILDGTERGAAATEGTRQP